MLLQPILRYKLIHFYTFYFETPQFEFCPGEMLRIEHSSYDMHVNPFVSRDFFVHVYLIINSTGKQWLYNVPNLLTNLVYARFTSSVCWYTPGLHHRFVGIRQVYIICLLVCCVRYSLMNIRRAGSAEGRLCSLVVAL